MLWRGNGDEMERTSRDVTVVDRPIDNVEYARECIALY